eukprot:15462874-Alexandrium_andersonii.AAC.1
MGDPLPAPAPAARAATAGKRCSASRARAGRACGHDCGRHAGHRGAYSTSCTSVAPRRRCASVSGWPTPPAAV